MKKLRIILQSKKTCVLLFLFIIIYVIINTIVIKHSSTITSHIIEGTVIDLSASDNSIKFTLKASEKIQCQYYGSDYTNYKNILGKKVRVSGTYKEINNNTIPNTFNCLTTSLYILSL